jgi:hypothetical protein
MATFLALTNRVLQDFNEPVITNVTSTEGVQTVAKDAVLEAIRTIYLSEEEWPFLQADQTQALTQGLSEYALPTNFIKTDFDNFILIHDNIVTNGTFVSNITNWTDSSTGTGSAAYTSDGNGRMRLNAGSSGVAIGTQSLTTITNKQYRVSGRILTGTITLKIGTISGGSETSSTSLIITNVGDGEYFDVLFTATATTHHITFTHSTNANYDVDYVEIRENKDPVKLKYIPYDELIRNYEKGIFWISENDLGTPEFVSKTQDEKFILYPVPDRDSFSVLFDAWIFPTDMTANSDTPSIIDRYQDVIVYGAKINVCEFRSDVELYRKYERKFKAGIDRMVVDLIGKDDSLRAV